MQIMIAPEDFTICGHTVKKGEKFLYKKEKSMKMTPFNLEKALAGEPVVTREGKKVLDLYYFKDCPDDQRLSALVEGDDSISSYNDNGRYWDDEDDSDSDLFMGVRTRKGYIAVKIKGANPQDESYQSTKFYIFKHELELLLAHRADGNEYTIQEIEVEI